MLKIVTYPDPILEKPADLVTFPLDNETKSLIKDMKQTVKDKGVGLAAPQVGVSKQICIIHLIEEILHKGEKPRDIVMINPKITFFSQLESLMVEGCLSFPDQYYEIWRPSNITVEYYDENGKKIIYKAKDWPARIIQHEVDHLNGNIFINKGGKKIEEREILQKTIVD